MDVIDRDVDLRDLHADEALHGGVDGRANVARNLLQGHGVLGDDGEVNGNLLLTDLDADTLAEIGAVKRIANGTERASCPPPRA